MTKLGNINFKDYDSDDTIRSSKYTSPSINKNRFKPPIFEKCKNKLKKINLDCKEGFNSERDKYYIESSESDSNSNSNSDSNSNSNSDSDCELKETSSSYDIRSKYRVGDCDIITYDNSKDYNDIRKKKIKKNFHKAKKALCNNYISNNDISDNDISDNIILSSESTSDCTSSYTSNNTSSYTSECNNFHDGCNISRCNDNINVNCQSNDKKCDNIKFYNNKICNFDQLDIVASKLQKILYSFKTISHLIQYYLRMLEQVKIEISQSDISHAVDSCIETTVSVVSYIKAEIKRNHTFILDDKHNNRDGYHLTNGLTKIYYIEKVKLSLLKNGEFIFGIYDEKKQLTEYELGGDYADVSYEGDLYIMIDVAKEKGIHFNKYIQNKYMKATSIYNLHLIYLNKYKI